jgi:hypothetical protein
VSRNASVGWVTYLRWIAIQSDTIATVFASLWLDLGLDKLNGGALPTGNRASPHCAIDARISESRAWNMSITY